MLVFDILCYSIFNMSEFSKNAIISVDDKRGIKRLADGVIEAGWLPFVTDGTNREYQFRGGPKLMSLADLVVKEQSIEVPGREEVALHVSELIMQGAVGLACVNLRSPRIELGEDSSKHVRFDRGGVFMIKAAINAGIIVVTNPSMYKDTLWQIDASPSVDADFVYELQLKAADHVADHFKTARSLLA